MGCAIDDAPPSKELHPRSSTDEGNEAQLHENPDVLVKNINCCSLQEDSFVKKLLSKAQIAKVAEERDERDFADLTDLQSRCCIPQNALVELARHGYKCKPTMFINLNMCSAATLATCKGIKSLAASIVQERQERGPFTDWNDLKSRVTGVGDKRLKLLQDHKVHIEPRRLELQPPEDAAGDAPNKSISASGQAYAADVDDSIAACVPESFSAAHSTPAKRGRGRPTKHPVPDPASIPASQPPSLCLQQVACDPLGHSSSATAALIARSAIALHAESNPALSCKSSSAQNADSATNGVAADAGAMASSIASEPALVKRGRGRPRKSAVQEALYPTVHLDCDSLAQQPEPEPLPDAAAALSNLACGLNVQSTVHRVEADAPEAASSSAAESVPVKRGRGRPKKTTAPDAAADVNQAAADGKPSLSEQAVEIHLDGSTLGNSDAAADDAAPVKRRGRPKKVIPEATVSQVEAASQSIASSSCAVNPSSHSPAPVKSLIQETGTVQPSVPAMKITMPTVQHFAPELQSSKPGLHSSELTMQSSAPAVQSSKPVAVSPAPAIHSSKPVAVSPAPAVQSSKPVAVSPAPAIQSSKPGVQSPTAAVQSSKLVVLSSTPAALSTVGESSEVNLPNNDGHSAQGVMPDAPWWEKEGDQKSPFPQEFNIGFNSSSKRKEYRYLNDFISAANAANSAQSAGTAGKAQPVPPPNTAPNLADLSPPSQSTRTAETNSHLTNTVKNISLQEGCSQTLYEYNGQTLTHDQVNALQASWMINYPIVNHSTNTLGNGRETPSDRSAATTSKINRQYVWDDLKMLKKVYSRIPYPWKKRFRVDYYGNMVALDAENMSVCGFDVDHIFPWSRGGLSCKENFMAVYWRANRHVKRDQMLNAGTDEFVNNMQCGLSLEQFLGLVERREGLNRRQQAKYDRLLEDLLLRAYNLPWNQLPSMAPEQVMYFLKDNYVAAIMDLTARAANENLLSFDE